jgi:hypothetical protein
MICMRWLIPSVTICLCLTLHTLAAQTSPPGLKGHGQ